MKNLSSASEVKQVIMTRITDSWTVGGAEGSYMYPEIGPWVTHVNTLSIITLQNIVTDVRKWKKKTISYRFKNNVVGGALFKFQDNIYSQTKCIHRFILYVCLFVILPIGTLTVLMSIWSLFVYCWTSRPARKYSIICLCHQALSVKDWKL